jgi:hypothetical protein
MLRNRDVVLDFANFSVPVELLDFAKPLGSGRTAPLRKTSRFRSNCSTLQNFSTSSDRARLDGQPSGQAIARRLREFQKKSGDTRRSRPAVTR